jgi:hypothetical protein
MHDPMGKTVARIKPMTARASDASWGPMTNEHHLRVRRFQNLYVRSTSNSEMIATAKVAVCVPRDHALSSTEALPQGASNAARARDAY